MLPGQMSTYQELVDLADRQRDERFEFEKRALDKINEMKSGLCAFLGCSEDKVTWVKLAPEDRTEAEAPVGTVMTTDGLRFALKVEIGPNSVGYMATIEPKNAYELLVHIAGSDTRLEITERSGVEAWCQWMEAFLRARLAASLNGRLSAKLSRY